jgi:hypothetical protein
MHDGGMRAARTRCEACARIGRADTPEVGPVATRVN